MKKIDPFYWILVLILNRLLKADLTQEEKSFVLGNIDKHRKVMWINLICSVSVFCGLHYGPQEKTDTIIMSLLAPVTVMGTAWFAVTFGGIPVKLIDFAMAITFWLFTAFMVSLSTMFLAVAFITSPWLWLPLTVVYIGAIRSFIMYDTADGFKSGSDDLSIKHSKAAIRYYRDMGIDDTAS